MKTKYGEKTLKECSKLMVKESNRMVEIAKEFKKADVKTFTWEQADELIQEFVECEDRRNSLQSVVNVMIRIESMLPPKPEKKRIMNPKGRD